MPMMSLAEKIINEDTHETRSLHSNRYNSGTKTSLKAEHYQQFIEAGDEDVET